MSRRTSLTLHREDLDTLDEFTAEGSPGLAAVHAWAADHGIDIADSAAEAWMIRILIRAGAEALRERVLEAGYSELAHTFNSDEHSDETRRALAAYAERTDRYIES
jgi:DNA-directed RNA polymerase specialized sigma24 family protein